MGGLPSSKLPIIVRETTLEPVVVTLQVKRRQLGNRHVHGSDTLVEGVCDRSIMTMPGTLHPGQM